MRKTLILVVEDDTDILRLVTHNLKSAEFDVLTAQDGYAALSLAKKHLPQLVILDLMLPGLDAADASHQTGGRAVAGIVVQCPFHAVGLLPVFYTHEVSAQTASGKVYPD